MPLSNIPIIKSALARLTPKQRQYAALGAILGCGVGALWAIFSFAGGGSKGASSASSATASGTTTPTNIGVMAPGQQVNPVDQWVGTAGRKLAQYEGEREEQTRVNRENKEFEDKTMQRFSELEQRLTNASTLKPASQPAAAPPSISPQPAIKAAQPASTPVTYPPAGAMPQSLAMPPGKPGQTSPAISAIPSDTGPVLTHISLGPSAKAISSKHASSTTSSGNDRPHTDTVDTFLPVSFTRGVMLGGLDAPTGGQSQANPHPVLIRLSDNSVLPNRYRAEYRDCFVIAAGYGDISSERAYLRTESLSCVRDDGSTLEVRIQGSIYGEDGKVGMRGRLVTKQGQMLANALLAGVVSGIGQGLATASTNTSTSALGTITTESGSEAYKAGLGSGVGRALDRLAQYYIKLAEQTFPVIEIDAGREIDVVITKGVRINVPVTSTSDTEAAFYPNESPVTKEFSNEE